MTRQVLNDHLGRRIGEICTMSNNNQYIYNYMGIKLGEYCPQNNTTYDRLGRRVGSGNLLTSLLV